MKEESTVLRGHPRSTAPKVLATFLLISLRNASIVTLAIAISVPAAVVTTLTLGADLVSEQAAMLTSQVGGTYIAVHEAPPEGGSCVGASVTVARVIYRNTSVKALVFESPNIKSTLKFFGAKVIKSAKGCNGVSVGSALAHVLGVDVGDEIKLCVSSCCVTTAVHSIHTGGGVLQTSVITAHSNITYSNVFLCLAQRRELAARILESANEGIEHALLVLSTVALASYAPIVFVGFRRFAASLTLHAEVLREAGAPTKVLRRCFTVACTILALAFAVYGLALGTVALHLGVWLARFMNIYLAVRPAPSSLEVAGVLTATTIMSVPASYLAAGVWGFED